MTKTKLFLELANPDDYGFSRKVYAKEFIGKYLTLRSGNGYKWPEAMIGKYEFIRGGKGDEWFIQLTGLSSTQKNRTISKTIYDEVKLKACEHTGYGDLTSDRIEVDHRNGRYNQPEALDVKEQKLEHFMSLTRRANLQKREDCKKCKLTDKRFDAKTLGYKKSVVFGDINYKGTCEGCYWFSPIEFRQKL